MRKLLALSLLITSSAFANPSSEGLRFTQIKTGEAVTLDALTYAGGALTRTKRLTHTAVLVEHPKGRFLFDTGLGRDIDAQFGADMPWYLKPLFAYQQLNPAADQLREARIAPPERIFLSHAHWDHASALMDFANAEVWLPTHEAEFLHTAEPPAVLPSQVSSPAIRWHRYDFPPRKYLSFEHSLDLFDDGSAVLVPLFGHSPGSVGLFLKTAAGRHVFFIGDVVWNADAVQAQAGKFMVASHLVDNDREQTLATVKQVAKLQQTLPDLVVIPAHDLAVQESLGMFPDWVE